jgi:DNA-binding transcriptional ArsR family regulator
MKTRLSRNEVIAHPIRLRIIGALAGRELSAEQVGQLLDDVAPATLYRHISILLDAGQVVVAGEERQRGGTTRLLKLSEGAGLLDRDDSDRNSPERNSHLVNTFLTRQIAGYASALRDPNCRPQEWTLRGAVIYLTEDEEREFLHEMLGIIGRFTNQRTHPEQRRRNAFIGVLPDRELPNTDHSERDKTT